MKNYVVLLFQDPATFDMTEAERNAEFAEYGTLTEELRNNGTFRDGDPVLPQEVKLVRVTGGEAEVMNGPVPGRNEVLVGYYKLAAESIDDVTRLASRIPAARKGYVEVLPVMAM